MDGLDLAVSLSPSREAAGNGGSDMCALLDEGRKAGNTLMDSQVSRNSQCRRVLSFYGWSRSMSSPFHEVLSRGSTLEITCPVLACQVRPAAPWEPADSGAGCTAFMKA